MTNFPLDTITLMRTFRKRLRATSTSQLQPPKTIGIRPNANTASGWLEQTTRHTLRIWYVRSNVAVAMSEPSWRVGEIRKLFVLHGARGRPVCISHFLFLCAGRVCLAFLFRFFLTINRFQASSLLRVVSYHSHTSLLAPSPTRARRENQKNLGILRLCWRKCGERVAADLVDQGKKGNLCISVDTFTENRWQLLLNSHFPFCANNYIERASRCTFFGHFTCLRGSCVSGDAEPLCAAISRGCAKKRTINQRHAKGATKKYRRK